MKFEGRELKPYAEPLSHRDLCEGHTYFFLTYVDEELLVPSLQPVVFIGRDLEEGESGRVWFQDYESHREGIRYGQPNASEGVFYSGMQEETGHVFEYEQALNLLMLCSLRRRGLC
jgi:hypothetical protein